MHTARRILLPILLLMAALTASAQHTKDFVEKFCEQHSGDSSIQSLTLSRQMIEAYAAQTAEADTASVLPINKLMAEAEGMRIVTGKGDDSEQYMAEAIEILRKYPKLFSHYTDIGDVKIYVRRQGKAHIAEVLMLSRPDDGPFVMMNVVGTFTEDLVKQFAGKARQ